MLMLRWDAVDSAAGTVAVVRDPESRELSFEVKLIPEQYLVQQFFPNRSDHAFNEGMRNLRSDFQIAEFGIWPFHFQHGGTKLRRGTLRPRPCSALAGIKQTVFAADQGLVAPHESRRSQHNRNLRSPIRRQPKEIEIEK